MEQVEALTELDPRSIALRRAIGYYEWVINQPRTGVSSPLARNLKQVIRMTFAKDGITAMAEVERAALNAKRVTPSMVGARPADPKKATEARRARRVSQEPDSAQEAMLSSAMQDRLRRVAQRGALQPTPDPELEERENVAGGEKISGDNQVKPLTTFEVRDILDLGAKGIVDRFGEDRIRATLVAMDPNAEIKGSARQMANRLKSILAS